eukprot:scaffold21444_cov30-Prasinocladus_malaysianus.AAC.3
MTVVKLAKAGTYTGMGELRMALKDGHFQKIISPHTLQSLDTTSLHKRLILQARGKCNLRNTALVMQSRVKSKAHFKGRRPYYIYLRGRCTMASMQSQLAVHRLMCGVSSGCWIYAPTLVVSVLQIMAHRVVTHVVVQRVLHTMIRRKASKGVASLTSPLWADTLVNLACCCPSRQTQVNDGCIIGC